MSLYLFIDVYVDIFICRIFMWVIWIFIKCYKDLITYFLVYIGFRVFSCLCYKMLILIIILIYIMDSKEMIKFFVREGRKIV